jgi:hypothetical protein
MGNRVFIGFRDRSDRGSRPESLPPAYSTQIISSSFPRGTETPFVGALPAGQEAVLDVEPFYTTRHVTLNWRSASGLLRQQVEAELGRALVDVGSRDNPVGGWLMIIASALFALIFFGVALTILIQIRMQRPF